MFKKIAFKSKQVLFASELNKLQENIESAFVPLTDGKQLSTEDYTKEDKAKLDSIKIADVVSANSTNLVTSSGISKALENKQDTLVSGSNIKTINDKSLLGEGNITLDEISIDEDLSATSTHAIQNKAVTNALANKQDTQAQWRMTWSDADKAIRITFL